MADLLTTSVASVPIGATLANLAAANSAPTFALQFNQIQNTIIRRVNDEIERVTETASTKRHEIAALQRDGLKLADALPVLTAYREGNSNNLGQIQKLIEESVVLADSLGDDDDVDASEVAAFEAQRDTLVETLNNLFVFIHPDIVDGQAIQNLKKEIDTLNALAPEVGSKSGLAANVAATDGVTSFQDKLQTALSVTQNTITLTLDLEQSVQSKQIDIFTKFTKLTTAEADRQKIEIDNIKAEFANVLTAISLTFEANQNLTGVLNGFLVPVVPQPGSILNIFT